MIVISDQQLHAFASHRLDLFVDDMVTYVRGRHATLETRTDDEGLREIVRARIARAQALGISLRAHFKRYLDLSFTLGADFCREPWAAKTLANADLVMAARLHKLEHDAVFRARVAVRAAK
ncbi:MAG TPA: hypothetical protein VGC23_07280 [Vicinamibacterales bacterium]